MSSKIITTVIGVALLAPFAYVGFHDARNIKQNLQAQHQHIQQLSTESAKLDTELAKTQETKAQSQQEVEKLEQQTQDAIKQREQLEAELGAN